MNYIVDSIAIRHRQLWSLPTGRLDSAKTPLRLVDPRTSHWSPQYRSLGSCCSLRLGIARDLEIGGQTDELAGSSAEQPARRHTSPTLALLEVNSAWFRHIEDDRQLDGYKERKRKNAEPFLSPCDLYQASVCFETFLAEFAAFLV